MSDSEKPNGCLGCLGIGCGVYVLLSVAGLIFYWCCNNAKEEVSKSTFKEIAQAQFRTDYGVPSGWDQFLKRFSYVGVDLNKKLNKALVSHGKMISDVSINEYEVADDVSRVVVAMQMNVKDASRKNVAVHVEINVLAQSKSLMQRRLSKLAGIHSVILSINDYSQELAMTETNKTTVSPGEGFVFLSGLFMNDDEFTKEFLQKFIERASRKNATETERKKASF